MAPFKSVTLRGGGHVILRHAPAKCPKGYRLDIEVNDGGVVTYWGDPRGTSSVEHGGAVVRGAAAEADKPLTEFGFGYDAVSPVPPLPRQRVRGTL